MKSAEQILIEASTIAVVGASRHEYKVAHTVPRQMLRQGWHVIPVNPAMTEVWGVPCYPSLAEGFGLPALEAMACGAPLVTTKGTSMEEVTGDTARLVRPGDVDELAPGFRSSILHRQIIFNGHELRMSARRVPARTSRSSRRSLRRHRRRSRSCPRRTSLGGRRPGVFRGSSRRGRALLG